jgi:hypothetical protein
MSNRTIAKDIVLFQERWFYSRNLRKLIDKFNSFSWISRLESWKKNLLAWVLRSSSLTQSSNISRKTQEHQEHSMVFEKEFDQTLRWDLARHNQTNLNIKTVKKQD